MKPPNAQRGFTFINDIRQERYWWVNANIQPMLAQPDQRTPIRFALISCSKSKLNTEAPARDLYTGQLFRKAVSWAERHDLQWFVVSALHGLLTPDHTVAPYNYTIKDKRRREREQWAHQLVAGELTRYASKHSHAILILPELYRRFIEVELFQNKITYENPLAGLGIGQQLKWLAEN